VSICKHKSADQLVNRNMKRNLSVGDISAVVGENDVGVGDEQGPFTQIRTRRNK